MTKCVFCVLCLFVFFFQVRKKQERVLYDIRHETILRKCMSLCDFVVSSHRACIRHPMCFCVFVFFSSEKHKNTLTKCFFVFFQHQDCTRQPMCFCVFVFFFRKIQKHIDQMFLCLFLTLGLHQTAYVFLCFCVFSGKHKNTLTHIFFFNNKIAPESQCVFVFLCFFLRKTQNTLTKCFFVFF